MNQFELCIKLGMERRAAMPKDYTRYADRDLTRGSNLPAGMRVNERNRPERLKNPDSEIHRGSAFIGKPLMVSTVDSEDEPAVTTEDDTKELSLSIAPIEAGEDCEEPESDSESEEVESDEEVEEAA
jgi:hypothetical protein